MSTANGLYRVGFETRLGAGAGVVVLHDGHLSGGDSMMFYQGRYQLDAGGAFKGEIVTNAHTRVAGMASVFGQDVVHIDLTGSMRADGGLASLQGVAREHPGMPFRATLTQLGA